MGKKKGERCTKIGTRDHFHKRVTRKKKTEFLGGVGRSETGDVVVVTE